MKADSNLVLELLECGVDQGVFPGGQLAVTAPGVAVLHAAGRTALSGSPSSRPVTLKTRYDIASLTKALSTSILLMQAVETKRLALDQTVDRWFPGVPSANQSTLALLASHRAGLAAHRPFYETIWDERLSDASSAKRRLQALICAEPLVVAPGTETIYSDLGYMLLGWILEAAFDGALNELFATRIAQPLGLSDIGFGPIAEPVAPTEWDETGHLLAGVVHDEHARLLGGFAGHAGLFSTAGAVMSLVRHLAAVHRGEQTRRIVSADTLRTFWRPISGSSYVLGWDTPTEPSSSGRYTTRGAAVGHLGFTGCSAWHDLKRDVTVVLLSNRVHPVRSNNGIRSYRPRLHDGVNEWLSAVSR